MALLNPCMKFKEKLGQINYKIVFAKNFHKMSQVQKEDFLKTPPIGFENLFLFWDCMNPLKACEGKLKGASFFTI